LFGDDSAVKYIGGVALMDEIRGVSGVSYLAMPEKQKRDE